MTDQERDHRASGERTFGGLIRPEPGHMPTLFSLILFWWLLTMTATVLVPYLLFRHTDDQPTTRTIMLWSILATASTLHGGMAYWAGYAKGGKVRNFLIGAILMPLSFPVIARLERDEPDRLPEHPRGFVRLLDRIAFQLGNIWFGIGQLAVMFLFLLRATLYENQFADKGNEAAYASYYNHPLMGLLFLLFFVTIYCATMRKYPFRWHQVGWLTVHSGLLMLMIGCMMMYWGSFSGFTILYEGERTRQILDNDVRELVVEIPSLRYKESHRVAVDFDTEQQDVEQVIPIAAEFNGRTESFEITLDRYLSRAEFFEDIVPSTNESAGAGMLVRITAPGFSDEKVMLEGGSTSRYQIGSLDLMLQGERPEIFIDSIGHAYEASDRSRGRLLVTKDGKRLAEIPVVVGDLAGGDAQKGRVVASPPTTSGELRIKVERYFDLLTVDGSGDPMDATPGQAQSPGLVVRVGGPSGDAVINVSSWLSNQPLPTENVYGLEFAYEVLHEFPIQPGMVLVARTPRDGWVIVMGTSAGLRREKLAIGAEYAFSDDAPIRFAIDKVLEKARRDEGLRPTTKTRNFRAVHGAVTGPGGREEFWLVNGMRVPREVRIGTRVIRLEYRSRRIELPFELSLLDFRRFEYPNSGKPVRFETNVVLRDPGENVKQAVLIDMNHPLGWGGYRFFNGSPLLEEDNARRGVLLTVGSNPGYPVILVSSILILIGIIVVFFFKKMIRDWDMARRRAA